MSRRARRWQEIHWPGMAFMYGPHGMPTGSHSRSKAACASGEYFGRRPRPDGRDGPAMTGSAGSLRAVDLPIPTPTRRSRISPFCFLDAFAYSALNLSARRFLVAMSSPLSIRQASTRKPNRIMRDFALTFF